MTSLEPSRARTWPDYNAVWRWHFYAGLLCIPFVLWLAATGSIYLFKPQIEGWLDAPYERLSTEGARSAPSAQVRAALRAVPGAHLNAYELPRTEHSAARVLLGQGEDVFRVYVDPRSLAVLKVVNEDNRFMNQISFLHGQLAIGERGSIIVELAACWAIIMLLTGVFLWWPRSLSGVGGVLAPRIRSGPRLFWRDLHAVTGIWVCGLALFLLLTGLPWAKNWGGYLREVRELTGTTEGAQDWSNGRADEISRRLDLAARPGTSPLEALDRITPNVAVMNLAPPVLITPPRLGADAWIAKSDAQNRTLRTTFEFDPQSGEAIGERPFAQRHPIDRVIGIGISAHEGALFGWFNVALSLTAALGLILLCVSAVILWLRRKPNGALGAPEQRARPRFSAALLSGVALLALFFPLFGLSLAIVCTIERVLLRRVAPVRAWLGLSPA
ncbi:iron-regulated membrane protein [alpha proteobacterium U9-1i]|nr:iron-regulated membrane protein [alpha proteobacterium U9-1i]